jgi:tetratricopeptide (TPR) repeat protein
MATPIQPNPAPEAPTPPPAGRSELSDAQKRQVKLLMDKASRLHNLGRIEEVDQLLREILKIDPVDPRALFNLAIIARDRKEYIVSEGFFRKLLEVDPDHIDGYQAWGDLLYDRRQLLGAVEAYEKALRLAPTRRPLLLSLMRARMAQRQPREVMAAAKRILQVEPEDSDALLHLGWAAVKLGQTDLALTQTNAMLAGNPDNARALALREVALAGAGRTDGAAEARERLKDLAMASWDMAKEVGDVFVLLDAPDRAIEIVTQYLSLHPEESAAEGQLAKLSMMDGDFQRGQELTNRAIEAVPDNLNMRMVQSLNAFRLGDFDLFHKYHWTRWKRDGAEVAWDLDVPEWDGHTVPDKALVLYSEQGVGDHVMWGSCIPAVAKVAPRVYFETNARLNSLFARSFPEYAVVTRGQLPKSWDLRNIGAKASAADLPQLMNLSFEKVPGKEGFLIPDPALMTKLRERYQAKFPGKRLVGISWRSGNRDSAGIRSVEIPFWGPILRNPDCAFINLQYGDCTADIALAKEELGVEIFHDDEINPMGSMDPFSAQIAALDVVISVDNSTIHFAGALGKTTWAMLPLNSDWRWLTERRDALWYSSLELFRQKAMSNWEPLVEEIAGRLKALPQAELDAAETSFLLRCGRHSFEHNRLDIAEDFYRLLLKKGAHRAEALRVIGVCAVEAGHPQDAVAILAGSVELSPTDLDTRADLAVALDACGETDRALKLGRDALRQDGANTRALLAMGRILTHRNRLDEATDYFARVLRGNPAHAVSRTALARAQAAQGEWQLAKTNFERAISSAPLDPSPHLGLAESSLRLGDFPAGWEHYRWRFGSRFGLLPPHLVMMNPDDQPEAWEEGNLRKARLFLRAERNVVDQLFLLGLLPEVAAETRSIIAEVDPAVLPLARASYPRVDFRAAGTTKPKELLDGKVRMASSLGDLAARFRPSETSFGKHQGLAPVDPARTAALRAEYQAQFPGRKLVGLSWRHGQGVDREPLERWAALFARETVGVVAIQIGADREQLAAFCNETGLPLLHDPRTDGAASSADYAVQLAALDLVIAADDIAAVLAASLGCPAFKLATGIEHWGWGAEGERTVWLPAARVFRSSVEDGAQVEQVMKTLAALEGF